MNKDGGSAFPEVFSTFDAERGTLTDVYSAGGMSIRDYFAAVALAICLPQAIRVLDKRRAELPEDTTFNEIFNETAANASYAMADAMIRARGANDS